MSLGRRPGVSRSFSESRITPSTSRRFHILPPTNRWVVLRVAFPCMPFGVFARLVGLPEDSAGDARTPARLPPTPPPFGVFPHQTRPPLTPAPRTLPPRTPSWPRDREPRRRDVARSALFQPYTPEEAPPFPSFQFKRTVWGIAEAVAHGGCKALADGLWTLPRQLGRKRLEGCNGILPDGRSIRHGAISPRDRFPRGTLRARNGCAMRCSVAPLGAESRRGRGEGKSAKRGVTGATTRVRVKAALRRDRRSQREGPVTVTDSESGRRGAMRSFANATLLQSSESLMAGSVRPRSAQGSAARAGASPGSNWEGPSQVCRPLTKTRGALYSVREWRIGFPKNRTYQIATRSRVQ